jgi:capsular exopolysaccharide synthesis family protein
MQGHRTLLLDADLRSPGLSARHLGEAEADSGLGGFLAGTVEAAHACFSTALPNLYLLSSGPMRADAAELLAGTRFPALLEDAFRWFDRVVIDTPAALSVTDTLAIARYAHRICLVVRDRGSDRRELKRAADQLRAAGGNPVGFVWNAAAAAGADAEFSVAGLTPPRTSIEPSPPAEISGEKLLPNPNFG